MSFKHLGLSVLFLLIAPAARADITSGLVCWLTFDENGGIAANDASGSGNTGTLSGSPLPAWGPGRKGQALTFDGSAAYVEILENSHLPVYKENTYTVAFWVNGAPNQNDKRVFAEGWSGGTGPVFDLGTNNANDKLDVFIRTNNNTGLLSHKLSTTVVYDNTWHHVVWTDDVSTPNTATLYIDGVQDATSFHYNAGGFAMTLNKDAVGVLERNSLQDFFAGSVDDVRLYNRVLSASDVQELYNSYVNRTRTLSHATLKHFKSGN